MLTVRYILGAVIGIGLGKVLIEIFGVVPCGVSAILFLVYLFSIGAV